MWAIREDEGQFNAVDRLFLHPASRERHGLHLADNIRPVIGMLQSSIGRQPDANEAVCASRSIRACSDLRLIWDEYEITSPLLTNACTIESPIGTFHYETVTLLLSTSQAIVVQVPDDASRKRLAAAETR